MQTMRQVAGWIVLAFLAGGCAAVDVGARLYDTQSGTVILATLEGFDIGHGRITAEAPDGERFTGDFSLNGWPTPYMGARFSLAQAAAEPQPGPAEVYGFGPDSDAKPVGSATLVGDRGTVLELILYSLSRPGQYGAGVASDNKGTRYRVHIGGRVE